MFYVSAKDGNKIYITDTSDNTVECYTAEDLKDVMIKNPSLVIKGVGVSYNGFLKIGFKVYNLSDNDKLKLLGAKPAIASYNSGSDGGKSGYRYKCHQCGLGVKSPTTKCSCGAYILWKNKATEVNSMTDTSGAILKYISVNSAKGLYKMKEEERLLGVY